MATLVSELDAHLDSPPDARTPLPLATVRALRLPLLPPAGPAPAYLLLLCDKAFALLDALTLEGEGRALRKRAIEGLKAVEGRVEQWKATLPPPPVLSREPEPPPPAAAPAAQRPAAGRAAPGAGRAPAGGKAAAAAAAAGGEQGFLARHGPSLGVLVAVAAWAVFYYLHSKDTK